MSDGLHSWCKSCIKELNARRRTIDGRVVYLKDPNAYDAAKPEPELIPVRERTVTRTVIERPSQPKFRQWMLERYGRCVITGVTNPKVLDAAHIKPFKMCKGDEYIDPDNGLLLQATMHRAFDNALISFENDGTLIGDPEIIGRYKRCLFPFTPKQVEYITGHREWFYSVTNYPRLET